MWYVLDIFAYIWIYVWIYFWYIAGTLVHVYIRILFSESRCYHTIQFVFITYQNDLFCVCLQQSAANSVKMNVWAPSRWPAEIACGAGAATSREWSIIAYDSYNMLAISNMPANAICSVVLQLCVCVSNQTTCALLVIQSYEF